MDVPDLITDAGNGLARHKQNIAILFSVFSGMIAGAQLFGIELVPYGESIIINLTRDGTIVGLLFMIAAVLFIMYPRVRWIVDTLEADSPPATDHEPKTGKQEQSDVDETIKTDGGNDLPPRDSKGKFTSKSQGGSNLLILALAAGAGYAFGSQYGPQEAIAGALFCAGAVLFLFD